MTRPLLAALAALALAAPSTHAAPPAPQVTDARGDWSLASQDVLSGRVSSLLVRGVPQLRGEIALAAQPAAGAPATYELTWGIGCAGYGFTYTWNGVPGGGSATLDQWDWCWDELQPWSDPEIRFPVTFAVRGSTLTFRTPYVGGIRRGQRAKRFHIQACTRVCGATVGVAPSVELGDYASSNASYVVGSDLPRR
jgi:hypothetical protein